MKNKKWAAAPFLRCADSALSMHLDVLISLIPVIVWAGIVFGIRVFQILLLTTGASVAVRLADNLFRFRDTPFTDWSGSALTGLLVGMCLPAAVPSYLALIAAVLASLCRILILRFPYFSCNPVCFSMVVLWVAAKGELWFSKPFAHLPLGEISSEEFAGSLAVSPVESLADKILPETSIADLFLGNCAGTIGELSALLLILGYIYLCIRKVIKVAGPLEMIGAVTVFVLLFPVTLDNVGSLGGELFSGATFLGAVYLANLPESSPKTDNARILYFLGCGVLSMVFRYFLPFADGVFTAIFMMSMLSRPLDRLLQPRYFRRNSTAGKRDYSEYNVEMSLQDLPDDTGNRYTH